MATEKMTWDKGEVKEIRTVQNPSVRILNRGIELYSNSTVRKGVITLGDQAVVSLTNFLTGVIISRNCTKEEFGLYLLGFSMVAFMTSLQTSFITTPYAVNSPHLTGKAHARYSGSVLFHNLIFSVFSVFCLTVMAPMLSLSAKFNQLENVVWALVIVISFILIKDFSRRYFLAGLQIRSLLVFDTGVGIVQIFGLLLLAQVDLLSAEWAYFAIGIACALPALSWFSFTKQKFTIEFKQSIRDFKKNWSLGKWIIFSGLIFQACNQAYPWFLTVFNGIDVAGALGACLGVVFLTNPLLIGMGNFLTPKMSHVFANEGSRGLLNIVVKATVIIMIIMSFFCFLMFLFGGSLVTWIYGANYNGNGLIVGILGLSLLAHGLTVPLTCGLLAIKRADVGFRSNLLALGFTITFGFWLVKSFGLVGVAYSLLVSNILSSSFKYFFFDKIIRGHITGSSKNL